MIENGALMLLCRQGAKSIFDSVNIRRKTKEKVL
jgi:hypothetical protein